ASNASDRSDASDASDASVCSAWTKTNIQNAVEGVPDPENVYVALHLAVTGRTEVSQSSHWSQSSLYDAMELFGKALCLARLRHAHRVLSCVALKTREFYAIFHGGRRRGGTGGGTEGFPGSPGSPGRTGGAHGCPVWLATENNQEEVDAGGRCST